MKKKKKKKNKKKSSGQPAIFITEVTTIFIEKIGVQVFSTQFCFKEDKSKNIINKMKPKQIQLIYIYKATENIKNRT